MKNILITGGTGLIGMHLSNLLTQKGYTVRHLSRRRNKQALYPAYQWDIEAGSIDSGAIEWADALLHLAGAGIADARWTERRKNILMDSRVQSTNLLCKYLADSTNPPAVVVSSSAIGYYGHQNDTVLDASSGHGTDFMSQICQAWEAAAAPIQKLGIRSAIIRIGVVLSTKGGALEQLLKSYSFRIGAYFGAGDQYYSWIHIDDLCTWFIKAIENESMTGIYNGTAPKPATNKEIAWAISKALNKPSILIPVPTFMAKLMMGEMSAVVLNSTRVSQPAGIADFDYQFEALVPAIKDLVKRNI